MSPVPGWRENWRRTQELERPSHPVDSTYSTAPPVLACQAGDFSVMPADADEETFRDCRDQAVEHARRTGHTVTVVLSRVFTVYPAGG